MANRERNVRLQVLVTEEEEALIKEKMTLLGTDNFSVYARKMLIDGYIIKREFEYMKELTTELSAIGRNINQIAKRTNETRNFYEQDMEDIKNDYQNVKALINERLVKIIRDEY